MWTAVGAASIQVERAALTHSSPARSGPARSGHASGPNHPTRAKVQRIDGLQVKAAWIKVKGAEW